VARGNGVAIKAIESAAPRTLQALYRTKKKTRRGGGRRTVFLYEFKTLNQFRKQQFTTHRSSVITIILHYIINMQINAHDIMYIIILQSSRADWVLILFITYLLLLIFFFHRMFASTKNSFLIIHVVPARLSANATHCRLVLLL